MSNRRDVMIGIMDKSGMWTITKVNIGLDTNNKFREVWPAIIDDTNGLDAWSEAKFVTQTKNGRMLYKEV